jgi:hypothetical protein
MSSSAKKCHETETERVWPRVRQPKTCRSHKINMPCGMRPYMCVIGSMILDTVADFFHLDRACRCLYADNGEELLVGNAGPKADIRLLGIRHRQGPCCL